MATKINDHIQQALDRLLEQYRNKPRIEGLISCFTEQIQDLEDVIFDLPEDLTIETAVGVQQERGCAACRKAESSTRRKQGRAHRAFGRELLVDRPEIRRNVA